MEVNVTTTLVSQSGSLTSTPPAHSGLLHRFLHCVLMVSEGPWVGKLFYVSLEEGDLHMMG